jgi:predicted Zn finger-like uncharacterized protein
MNIRCPQCQTTFRVNPDRIPPKGARAKCARCGATFMVKPPASAAEPATVGAVATAPPPPPAQAAPRPEAPVRQPEVPQTKPSASPPPSAPPARAPEPAAPSYSPFGSKDPGARAERLARALVSDIVAYHPERREKSLADGTIRTEFRDEILKSWEEYVAQVGLPMAKSTPHFRSALNKILAKGHNIF